MRKHLHTLTILLLPSVLLAQNAEKTAMEKLQIVQYAISRLYVDSINSNEVAEQGIRAMLRTLDPHSTYSTPEEVEELNEPLHGNFDGIGVQFQMIEDTLTVIQPVVGGPSEDAGIQAGDRIYEVDGIRIAGVGMSTDEITSRLKGPKGTTVHLSIVRRGVNKPLDFKVKRGSIPLNSVDAAYMVEAGIGYIKLSRFAQNSAQEVRDAITSLREKGLVDLILDLQGNGGGYLNAAIDIANEFLSQKDLIVYTEGRAEQESRFSAKGNGKFRQGRLVVMVDEYSASASEIVSGAIQDWDRGLLIGRRTFGKGLVQRPINLPDHSMIRLTVARYHTPSGRCIQKPYAKSADGNAREVDLEQYNRDLVDRYNHGELLHQDSIQLTDTLVYKTLRLGRTVFGGGGIHPDFFVPMDTIRYSGYHSELISKGILNMTIAHFLDQNRRQLEKTYRDFEAFNQSFQVPEKLIQDLIGEGLKSGIPFIQEDLKVSESLIGLQLKALIARNLWGTGAYYHIMNSVNSSYIKAIEVLNTDLYDSLMGQ